MEALQANLCVGINNVSRALERMPAKSAITSLGEPQSKRSKTVSNIVTELEALGQQIQPKRAKATPLQVLSMSFLFTVGIILILFSISRCCVALM